jgi:hypothetical protein
VSNGARPYLFFGDHLSYGQVDNVSNRFAYGLAAKHEVRESVTKRPAELWNRLKAGIRLQR